MHFHAKKASKSCEKKSFLGMQMVKHVIVHFRDEKSRKKSKFTHKNVEKHNALIRLLRKNQSKSLFFLIKTTHFHAKKHRNLAKKIIPGPANGVACHRTFSR